MKKLNILLLMPVLMLLVASCGSQTQEAGKKQNTIDTNRAWSAEDYEQLEKDTEFDIDEKYAVVRALNDKGVKLMQMSLPYPNGSSVKDSLLNEALNNLNEAIEKQKDYYYSYFNKANVLKEMGKYDAALRSLEELLKVKEDYPEAIFIIGLIYEKIGNMDKAQQKYKEALRAYEDYLKTPMATVQDKTNKDLVLLFIEGKEKVLERINEQIKKDPDNSDLLINKQIIEQFDREEYFKDF